MVRNAIIVVLLVVVAVLADRVVREENQRYALLLGKCAAPVEGTDTTCLDQVQSRSAWGWHLLYGLTSQIPAVPWTSK